MYTRCAVQTGAVRSNSFTGHLDNEVALALQQVNAYQANLHRRALKVHP